jgi:hypothetical protein
MFDHLTWLAFLLLFPQSLRATEEVRPDERGTFLGILFRTRSDVAGASTTDRAATSRTASARGVVITHVLPDSPAARADLRRNEVLIGYDRRPIRDGDHLAELIRADRPDRKVQLQVLRDNRIQSIEVTLALGPALRLSGERRTDGTTATRAPRNGSVSLWATPAEEGGMKLTIEYTDRGKLQVLTCGETGPDLAATLQKLPERERQLVRIALQRLRTLNSAKTEPPARR